MVRPLVRQHVAGVRARGAALQQALDALEGYLDLAAPGTLLPSERELARRFGVSRTTLRSAVAELAVQGRLEVRHGTGTLVRSPSRDQGEFGPVLDGADQPASGELAELCRLVETQLARLAAIRATPAESLLIAGAAGESGVAFHLKIAAATGNASASRLVAWLHDSLDEAHAREGRAPSLDGGRLLVDLRRSVASAIAANDADAAEGAMSLYLTTRLRLPRLA